MKKISLFMMALATMAMCVTSCKKKDKDNTDLDNVIEDGFYCVGPATTVADISATNLKEAQMGAGTNEVDKQKRAGMYEKYIYLTANQDFSLVLHKEGQTDVVYGANLQDTLAISDNAEIEIHQYKGLLAQNLTMRVPKAGLYHIILDLNQQGDLSSMGGAMIAVIPCTWGLRGWQNDWGFREMKIVESSASKIIYEYRPEVPDTIMTTQSFKFAHSNCWKFNLDMAGLVKAENSIGTNAAEDGGEYTELLAGGKNIPLPRGIYDYVRLTWIIQGGAMAKSFAFEAHKCGELAAADYSNSEIGLVGTAVAEQTGAVPDAGWSWGNFFNFGKPTKDGDVYTWTKENVLLEKSECKVRSLNTTDKPYVEIGDGGSNFSIAERALYKVVVVIDAAADTKNVTFTKTGDAPTIEYRTGTIRVEKWADHDDCVYLYGFGESEIFGAWPGIQGREEENYLVFDYTEGVLDGQYKFIINNNNDTQTGDSDYLLTVTENDQETIIKVDNNVLVPSAPSVDKR